MVNQQEFTKAKEQFQRILNIESNNLLAKEKIQEINEITKHEILNKVVNIDSENSPQVTAKKLTVFPNVLLAFGVFLVIIIIIGFLIYQSSTACPKGEQKRQGIVCVKDLRD